LLLDRRLFGRRRSCRFRDNRRGWRRAIALAGGKHKIPAGAKPGKDKPGDNKYSRYGQTLLLGPEFVIVLKITAEIVVNDLLFFLGLSTELNLIKPGIFQRIRCGRRGSGRWERRSLGRWWRRWRRRKRRPRQR
jgi:hypothetical protein